MKPNGWKNLALYLAVAVIIAWGGFLCIANQGCVNQKPESNNEFVGPEYVAGDNKTKVDAHNSFATVKMLEDAKIEFKTQVQTEVAAQINKVGGDQNSTLALIAAIVTGPLCILLDKLSRRSKTIRKIDAAVKGHGKVTVSE